METNNKPKINGVEFTTDVNNGMNKAELIAKYGISSASVKEIATTLGLTIKRAVVAKYTLVWDVATPVKTDEKTFEYTSGLNA